MIHSLALRACKIVGATALVAAQCTLPASARGDEAAQRDEFSKDTLAGWKPREGNWKVEDGQLTAAAGFSTILLDAAQRQDVEVAAHVAYSHDAAHAASGILFRFRDDATGYAACVREIERGVHERFGQWERPVVQLFRLDRDGWKLLQESKVMNCQDGKLVRLKIACRGPNIWVYCDDMATPVLTEFDDAYVRAGHVGVWKDHVGTGRFDNFAASAVGVEPPLPSTTDWSWVRGAVYVRSNAVNSVEMWHDYWDHVATVDRELSLARLYGFNMVQVYLHFIVWDRHGQEYVKRIDDFLTRADKQGLAVNFIFWDDCGHVEPSLSPSRPIAGRHNSQMMPNPSHAVRDERAKLLANKDRYEEYVSSIARRFGDDRRVAFWQLYNECLGPKERYRVGESDANLNDLLGWTRQWIKQTGSKMPVTATGGGFYGPKYSDFYSYHSYASGKQPLPNADGGPEHLCTETLNRPEAGLVDCVQQFGAKRNGFVVWELMIGRDNCRFPWGHPDGPAEPSAPFHGVVYPDGHPWDVREVEALLGVSQFAALKERLFQVEYYTGRFAQKKKTSVVPAIDFDLGDEPGYGSPDASAGVGKDDFSIRWTGRLVAPATGMYQIAGESDGVVRILFDEQPLVDTSEHDGKEVRGKIDLVEGKTYRIQVDYFHRDGPASCHVFWTPPGQVKQVLRIGGKR